MLLRFLKASSLPTENPALPSAPSPSPLSCQSCLPELSASLSLQPAWSQPSSPRVVSALTLTVFPGHFLVLVTVGPFVQPVFTECCFARRNTKRGSRGPNLGFPVQTLAGGEAMGTLSGEGTLQFGEVRKPPCGQGWPGLSGPCWDLLGCRRG